MARSKSNIAARDFSYGGATFAAGDELPDGVLRAVLRYGDTFVTQPTPKTNDKPTNGGN